MSSRLSKYDVEEKNTRTSRVKKNEELYLNINKGELDNYNVMSNTTILGENKKNEIDIDKIKKILDTKYNEVPKRRSIRIDEEKEVVEENNNKILEATKEYDINAILHKARSGKPASYEDDRAKKMRDTQFDILKNLDIENYKKEETEPKKTGEDNLLDLINTITINEEKKKMDKKEIENDLDLFSDLKGSENTVVVEGIKEKVAEITPLAEIKKEVEEQKEVVSNKLNNTVQLKEEFYTTSTKFDKKDFEDLGIEDGKRNIVTEIIVVLILVAFLAGMFFFFKDVLGF